MPGSVFAEPSAAIRILIETRVDVVRLYCLQSCELNTRYSDVKGEFQSVRERQLVLS